MFSYGFIHFQNIFIMGSRDRQYLREGMSFISSISQGITALATPQLFSLTLARFFVLQLSQAMQTMNESLVFSFPHFLKLKKFANIIHKWISSIIFVWLGEGGNRYLQVTCPRGFPQPPVTSSLQLARSPSFLLPHRLHSTSVPHCSILSCKAI